MNKKIKEELREQFRLWAIEVAGGCDIQEGTNKKSYPCGTCFNAGIGMLINEKAKDYQRHNEPVDRINEVWRFILQLRDEKY